MAEQPARKLLKDQRYTIDIRTGHAWDKGQVTYTAREATAKLAELGLSNDPNYRITEAEEG